MTVAAGAIGLLMAVALCALLHVMVMAFAGRALGVALHELSFGLGPRLLRLGKVSIRLLPVGGAVRFQTADATMPADDAMLTDSADVDIQPAVDKDIDPQHLEAPGSLRPSSISATVSDTPVRCRQCATASHHGHQTTLATYLYSTVGSHMPIPGNMYSRKIATTWMPMNGIMPRKIWFNVTCGGDTPFR